MATGARWLARAHLLASSTCALHLIIIASLMQLTPRSFLAAREHHTARYDWKRRRGFNFLLGELCIGDIGHVLKAHPNCRHMYLLIGGNKIGKEIIPTPSGDQRRLFCVLVCLLSRFLSGVGGGLCLGVFCSCPVHQLRRFAQGTCTFPFA